MSNAEKPVEKSLLEQVNTVLEQGGIHPVAAKDLEPGALTETAGKMQLKVQEADEKLRFDEGATKTRRLEFRAAAVAAINLLEGAQAA